MRGLAGAVAVAAIGIGAGQAAGDTGLPTLPSVTVPTVTVPAVSVPQIHASAPVSAPKVSAPSAPSAPKAPSAPVQVPVATGTASATSGVTGSTYSGSTPGTTSHTRKSPPRVSKLRVSKPYLSLSKRSAIRVTFTLPRAGTIVLIVQQIAPVCRLTARVRVRGHEGRNAIRLGTRIGRRDLGAGTYRVVPRRAWLHGGKGITVVVLESSSPTSAEVAAARAENACGAGGSSASSSFGPSAANAGSAPITPGATAAGGKQSSGAPFKPRSSQPPSSTPSGSKSTGQASGFVPTNGTGSSDWMRPLLLAGVALATLLLALAAMPEAVARTSRFGEVVANRRLSLALAGSATLVAFVLAYVVAGNSA